MKRINSSRLNSVAGITITEVIVSTVLMMTIMGLVGTVCHRVNLIWFDVNHHRVAVSELSNQLEELTALTLDQAAVAVKTIEPSESCRRALASPELNGEIFEDRLGSRILLKINWARAHPAKPVEMSGWIIPFGQETASDAANDTLDMEDKP